MEMLLLLITLLLELCSGSKTLKTKELMETLLTNTTADIRPGLEETDPLAVNVSLNLVAMTELNEVKGYISTVGFLDLTWIDERMSWNPAEYDDIQSISVASSKIWKPEIVVANSVDKIYSFDEFETSVRFFSNGYAWWRPGNVMKTSCFIQIPSYPFDVHMCPISMAAWGTLPSEVVLKSTLQTIKTAFYSENTEWALTGSSAAAVQVGIELSMVGFSIQFSRKSTFHVVNVLLPIVFLSLLNSVVFLLPQESGERVSFSVTILLSFTVFLTVIGDNIPKTSSPMPLLCYYVITVLVMSGFITILATVCQRLYHTRGHEPIPKLLKAFFCMRCAHSQTKVVSLTENGDEKTTSKDITVTSPEAITWKDVILRIDRILFFFFFILAIVFALSLFVCIAIANTSPKN